MLKKYGEAIKIGCAVLLYTVIIGVLGIGCPIKYLTGIPCLGCGMTRACVALMHFDFSGAFYYHPLVFFLPVLALFLLFRTHIIKYEKYVWGVTITLFMIVYLIRLFILKSEVVEINLSDGFLYKFISNIFKGGK